MTGRTHMLSSGILGLMVCYKMDVPAIYTYACVVGSLFPDADHRSAILGRMLPLWLFFKPHRNNLLHSLPGAFVFSGLMLFAGGPSAFMFFIGYLLHLGLDMLNPMGVRLMWPRKGMISIAKIRSGSWLEWPFLFGFYLLLVVVMSL